MTTSAPTLGRCNARASSGYYCPCKRFVPSTYDDETCTCEHYDDEHEGFTL